MLVIRDRIEKKKEKEADLCFMLALSYIYNFIILYYYKDIIYIIIIKINKNIIKILNSIHNIIMSCLFLGFLSNIK